MNDTAPMGEAVAETTAPQVSESVASAAPIEAAPTAAPAADAKWFDSYDDVTKGMLATKGWNMDDINEAMPKALKSYSELEKLNGKDKIALPNFENADETNDFYNKLGRPETPDLYEFKAPEGMNVDEGLDTWFRESAHAQGLTDKQAKSMFESYNEVVMQRNEAFTQDLKVQDEIYEKELRSEWGQAYDHKSNQADAAVRNFIGDVNKDPEASAKVGLLKQALGQKDYMKLFNAIGSKIGEHGGNAPGDAPSVLSPEEAKYQISVINNDPVQSAQYFNDYGNGIDSPITKKMRYLNQVAAGE